MKCCEFKENGADDKADVLGCRLHVLVRQRVYMLPDIPGLYYTDGQSEITIRVLEHLIWSYVEHRPSTWVKHLPLVDFVANNTVNANAKYSPFYLNQGRHPLVLNILLAKGELKVSNEAVKEAL